MTECPVCKVDDERRPTAYCTGCNRVVCSDCYTPWGLCADCNPEPPDEVA